MARVRVRIRVKIMVRVRVKDRNRVRPCFKIRTGRVILSHPFQPPPSQIYWLVNQSELVSAQKLY